MSAPPPTGLQAELSLQRGDFSLAVQLNLPDRGVTALFGPSGSGKTTCLRILAGLETQAQGRVSLGSSVWQDSAQRLWVPPHRRAVGVVFQEASLFSHLTVAGNLRYGLTRVPRAEQRFTLPQVCDWLGLGPLMDRWPHTLSGGERQRVALARALATSPQLLLMDEPLSALDQTRKAELLPWLEQLTRSLDLPVVYVSHAPDEVARLADHLVLLDRGRVQASGPLAPLMTRLDLPLAQGKDASAVLTGKVAELDLADHLLGVQVGPTRVWLPMGSRPPAVGQPVRLRVMARDVSLALQPPPGSSILNILPARVSALQTDAMGQCLLTLDCEGQTLLARITGRSARVLQLRPGLAVFAQVKGMAVV